MNEKELASYLHSKNVDGFLKEVRKKYESYGKLTGRISPADDECADLSGILGRTVSSHHQISVQSFSDALNDTKYGPVNMRALLEEYFREPLVTRQQKREEKLALLNEFHHRILEIGNELNADREIMTWLHQMVETGSCGYRIVQKYENSPESILLPVVYGLQLLRQETFREPLAVFASSVSGNPHFLDRTEDGGKLFAYGLCACSGRPYPANGQQWTSLFEQAGIISDEIAGSVALYQIDLYRHDGIHRSALESYAYHEPFVCTHTTLNSLVSAGNRNQTILIVENEMVFTYLMERMNDSSFGLMCTSGQLSTAAWKLIDLLVSSEAQIFYSGDMDPEGLLIAQGIVNATDGKVRIRHMGKESYLSALSEEKISSRRLSLLRNITHPVLMETAKVMEKYCKAAYQENMIGTYTAEIGSGKRLK